MADSDTQTLARGHLSARSPDKLTIVFNYRSPFCALIVDRLLTLARRYRIDIEWRIVSEVPRPSSLPITETNPRFKYNRQDCQRRAIWLGLPWNPPSWRLADVAEASRIGQWLLRTASPLFAPYTLRLSRAYWCEGHNTSDPAVVERLAREVGVTDAQLKTVAEEGVSLDAELSENTRWCDESGVLGVPYFSVGDQAFWGSDRLGALERHLSDLGLGPRLSGADEGLMFDTRATPTLPIQGRESCLTVGRVFCVGRNYGAHAREMGKDPDRDPPFFFMKPADAVVRSGGEVPYPPGTTNYQYEVELVVVLGAPVVGDTPEAALNAVFGYAAGLDLTRRDLQLAARDRGHPWELGKSFENSAVVGSVRPARDAEMGPLGAISLAVNGVTKQDAKLADMLWSVPEIILNLANYFHLKAGDLIFTGTPAGVGPIEVGDHLLGVIEEVGEVATRIASPLAATPS